MMQRALACLLLTLFTFGAAAHAALPPILDRTPEDAAAVVVAPSLDQLNDRVIRLIGTMELTMSNLEQILGVLGLRDGVDIQGAAAVILRDVGKDAPLTDGLVILAPTPQRDALLTALKAEPDGDLHRFDFNGSTLFARPISDDLTAIGMSRVAIEDYDGAPGRLNAVAERIGDAASIIERSQIGLIVNIDRADRLFALLEETLSSGAADRIPFGQAIASPMASILRHNARLLRESGDGAVIGMDISSLGVRLDMSGVFDAESEMATLIDAQVAQDGDPLSRFPNRPYIAAAWSDLNPDILRLMTPPAIIFKPDLLEGVTRAEFVTYAPRLVTQAVIADSVLRWEGPEAADASSRIEQTLAFLAAEAPESNPMRLEYAPDATNVGDIKADVWSVSQRQGKGFTPMALYFGPGLGPQGIVLARETDGYMTLRRDEELIAMCIALTDDLGDGLDSHPMTGQLLSMLPEDAHAGALLNLQPVIQQVNQFTMAMMRINLNPAQQLPPIGVALTMDGRIAGATAYVPAPNLRLMLNAWAGFRQMSAGGK